MRGRTDKTMGDKKKRIGKVTITKIIGFTAPFVILFGLAPLIQLIPNLDAVVIAFVIVATAMMVFLGIVAFTTERQVR